MQFLRKKSSKDINFLELTPYRLYQHDKKADGLIDVLVPRFNDKIFGRLLQPRLKNPYIKANLDKLGSAAWLEIDGNKNVFEIIETLDNDFGEEISPSQKRITLFLSYLHRNGFISFKEFNKEN